MNRRDALASLTLLAGSAASAQAPRGRGRGGPGMGPQPAQTPPLAKDAGEQKILAVLDEMEKEHKTFLSVPPQDGRWLRLLAETANSKKAVEAGTSTGYSGLWLALALRSTGGRLAAHEIDPGRAAMAREHFQKAGVDGLITVVEGDAHAGVRKLDGPIDFVFIDAEKEGYTAYLERASPKVRPGGLILAHNIGMNQEYVAGRRLQRATRNRVLHGRRRAGRDDEEALTPVALDPDVAAVARRPAAGNPGGAPARR